MSSCAKEKPDSLSIIRKSDIYDKKKQDFFQAVALSALLYGWTTCILTKPMEKRTDGNYIGMLRAVLNKSLKQHSTKLQLFDHLIVYKQITAV